MERGEGMRDVAGDELGGGGGWYVSGEGWKMGLRAGGIFVMHFCPRTMTTQAESINSNLQRGLDRRLRHTRQ